MFNYKLSFHDFLIKHQCMLVCSSLLEIYKGLFYFFKAFCATRLVILTKCYRVEDNLQLLKRRETSTPLPGLCSIVSGLLSSDVQGTKELQAVFFKVRGFPMVARAEGLLSVS